MGRCWTKIEYTRATNRVGWNSTQMKSAISPNPDLVAESKPQAAVDLRSDTVTTPTPEMRRAMAEAEVGDDGYHEDPTVNRLESLAAALLGKEAALYVPSGTMANQLALRVVGRPGTDVLCAARSHVF